MLNHEGSHHEHFEELCALAATGQISEPDFVELQSHVQQCADCRAVYTDFIDLLHDKLPLAHPDVIGSSKLPTFLFETSSYQERFLARARMEGVVVPLEPSRDIVSKLRSWFWPRLAAAQLVALAMAVLLVTVGLLGYSLYQSNMSYRRLASDRAELARQLSQKTRVVNSTDESRPASPPPREAVPAASPNVPPGQKTETERTKVQSGRAAAEARSKALEDQLLKVISELEALKT